MKYPNILDEHAPEWDAADALVALLFGYPDIRGRAVNVVSEKSFRPYSNKLRVDWNGWRGYGN
jgi:hypothetical protein